MWILVTRGKGNKKWSLALSYSFTTKKAAEKLAARCSIDNPNIEFGVVYVDDKNVKVIK